MAKQTVTVTAEVEVPDGYEPTGEIRRVGADEFWVHPGSPSTVVPGPTMGQYVVLRKREPVSLTLKPGWIAMDYDGEWWWYSRKPEVGCSVWGSSMLKRCLGKCEVFDGLPECDDWTKSLRRV